MRVRDIISEDFVNYKEPCMFISMGFCNWKCCTEQGLDISICQNSEVANSPEIDIDNEKIIDMYVNNPITKAIVIGGLEPFTYTYAMYKFISQLREVSNDPVIIYTGYYPEELYEELSQYIKFDNIIIKFGRFIPNQEKHIDPTLGVELASDNQYAEELTNDLLNRVYEKVKDNIYDI